MLQIWNLYRHPSGENANDYCCIQERPPHRAETTRDIEKPIDQTQLMEVLAYTSLGGMDDSGEEENDGNRGSLPMMNISDVIGRRLQVDPLERIARRRDKPTIARDTLLQYIDDVSVEVEAPFHDDAADSSAYIRVCCMVKALYGQMRSDNVNQCVIDECCAISILERVARAHADGIYRWRKSA